ncbi:MAG TPA: flagellar basal body-associated FliL family protein [Gammaproteobacteria bacterium]|nr:flagellar basal body-associated FliL family protein [Gammaproteobacteria bacterium]
MPLIRLTLIMIGLIIFANSQASAEGGGGGGSSLYVPLEPAFVVNVNDGKRVRHMQIKLQVKLKQARFASYIEEHNPAIRNALVMLLSGQETSMLKTAAGKQKLMDEALAAIQQVLEENIGNTGIDAVYFTDLIIQ